jgi:hypothetical protein
MNRRLERIVIQDESQQAIIDLDSEDEEFIKNLGPGERKKFILNRVKCDSATFHMPEGGHNLVQGVDVKDLDNNPDLREKYLNDIKDNIVRKN